jgi:primosomal protein N''
MTTSAQTVTFTLEEVNQILNILGEVPAKYSLDLVTFIRGKAQSQLQAASEVTDVVAQ